MKSIVLLGLLCTSFCVMAGEISGLSLREHMRALSFLVDQVNAAADVPERGPELIEATGKIRAHMVLAIAMTPAKLERLSFESRAIETLEYQGTMAEVLLTTIELERALRSHPETEELKLRRVFTIGAAVRRLNKLIGVGHERFR